MNPVRSPRALRTVSWAACSLTTALALSGVLFVAAQPPNASFPGDDLALTAYEALVYTTIAVVGGVVTSRQPRNAIGWVLHLIGLALALNAVGNHLYYRALFTDGDVTGYASYAAWSVSWLWIFAIVPAFVVFPLLFPTGRLQSPRWRPLLWVALVAGAVLWFGTAFAPGPFDDYPAAVNPFGLDSPAVDILGWAGFGILVPTALGAIGSVVVRFRRSTGTERQQLKLVAAAAALLPVGFSGAGLQDDDVDLGFVVLLTSLFVVVAAVAIAMLRYRLYDIDIVVNRTLVYGALTATLAGAYVGGVMLLQLVLRPLTERSDLAVAGSTLAVAALFRPVRATIQAWVDRRFYRGRYDAIRTLAAFSGRMREQLDLETLADDLRVVVHETIAPAHVSLWLRNR